MALENTDIRVEGRDGRLSPSEPSLGELFGQLTSDATRLIKQEVALAKAELRETGSNVAKDLGKLAVAAGAGLLGAQALVAFLIIGLGALIDNYWLSALIVTVLLLVIAAVMGKNAGNGMKRHMAPPQATLETLREDAAWAKREAQELKQEWKS